MSINLTRQSWILFLLVISITHTLSSELICASADEQTQNKPASNQSNVEKQNDKADQEQSRPTKEKLKKLVSPNQLPVEPIIEEMKRAGELIKNRQTGAKTQQLQQRVVQNLAALIQQMEAASNSSMNQPNQKQQSNNSKKNKQQKSERGQKNGSQLSQGPARQSSERKEAGKVTTGSLENRNVYIKEAWGHLPPAMRQQLLNIYTEKFLPQYEDQVRRYYEALAEQKKRSP